MRPLAASAAMHQRSAGANVQRPHRCTVEPRRAGDDRGLARRDHVGAHLPQLADVEKAVLINALVDDADAAGLGQEGGKRWLQVGSQAGVGQRLGLDGVGAALAPQTLSTPSPASTVDAGLAQLADKGVEVLAGMAPSIVTLAVRNRRGERKETSLEAVRDNAVPRAERVDTVDFDKGAAGAA